MSGLDDVERAVAMFRDQTVGLTLADLERPTPCLGWDVRTLTAHVVGIYEAVHNASHGERVNLVAASALLGDAPERTINDAATAMMRAWREPAHSIARWPRTSETCLRRSRLGS